MSNFPHPTHVKFPGETELLKKVVLFFCLGRYKMEICISFTCLISLLNLSTIDDLGSWCLKGWWSQAAIKHGEGGIHGNHASGQHQWHCHTESNQWNTYQARPDTYQRESREGEARQNDLHVSRRPASKQMRCEPWGAPQQRIQRSPLSRDKTRLLTGIELTLTSPKLHLATLKFSGLWLSQRCQICVSTEITIS